MKVSFNWLNEFVPIDISPKELCLRLTAFGLESSVISSTECNWTEVVTARVLEKSKHPNADKLSVCKVSDGTNIFSVVCGAVNVAQGQTVAFAKLGAVLPGGFEIKRAKIRGIESEGMICSEKELGLSDEALGIMVLSESTPVGKPFEETLADKDTLLEIEITTNRPDCLSHLGIAREIAAMLGKKVVLPQIKDFKDDGKVKISVVDRELCSRYLGVQISNCSVGASPDWLRRRLEKCGIRSINNIVDITNYVLLELGHPLHAFDFSKLAGGEIVVRRAKKTEAIRLLDTKEYKLDEQNLVISDNSVPQALAGIMGSELSGVDEKSSIVILESAVFNGPNIRKSSKSLNISSDASYRFERGTSSDTAKLASRRAANLICELTGGIITASTDIFEHSYQPLIIELRIERVEKILDLKLDLDSIINKLALFGFQSIAHGSKLTVTVPPWRLDVSKEIDLIEEIAKAFGYENIPTTLPAIYPSLLDEPPPVQLERILSQRLTGLGFYEAINYSFLEEKEVEFFKLPVAERIGNPLSKENEVLRPSLLPLLWKNMAVNLGQGYEQIRFFETGRVFTQSGEKNVLGIIACGQVFPHWWNSRDCITNAEFDFNFFHGALRNVFYGNEPQVKRHDNPPYHYHPNKCASIKIAGKLIGSFGTIRPELLTALGIKEVSYGEFDLDVLKEVWGLKAAKYVPVKKLPLVKRDLSILSKKDVSFDNLSNIINESLKQGRIPCTYSLVDIFEDEAKFGNDKRSITLHFEFRPQEQTLTDKEVSDSLSVLVNNLANKTGATLR